MPCNRRLFIQLKRFRGTISVIILISVVTLLLQYHQREKVDHIDSRWLLSPKITPQMGSLTTFNLQEQEQENKIFKEEEINVQEKLEERLPNLPYSYWSKYNKKINGKKNTCTGIPNIFDLAYNNNYWQELVTSNGTFYLLSAYYDNRTINQLKPCVRIVGMINRIEPTITAHCQFWFESSLEPVVEKVFEYKYIWNKKWGNYKQEINQPYLITCRIPKKFESEVPSAISIVEKKCDLAKTLLRVVYNKPQDGTTNKKDFAVCVKGLDFLHKDLTVRLAEWIELLGILGADKIFLYELQTHPNISGLLRHYENSHQIEVTPLTLPGKVPNAPYFQHLFLTNKVIHKRQNEVIPYNDCFYKNIYRYRYIVLLDIDEVIVPIKHRNWKELIQEMENKHSNGKIVSSFVARNVYFLDDLKHEHEWFDGIPHYLHMLQHVYRTENFTKPGAYVKCFHNTEKVLILHNHFPFGCLGGCSSVSMPTDLAQLQHYRADCVKELGKTCKEMKNSVVKDTTLWKYKDALINKTSSALRILKIL